MMKGQAGMFFSQGVAVSIHNSTLNSFANKADTAIPRQVWLPPLS